jgi:Ankyrin repeats (3 copies)
VIQVNCNFIILSYNKHFLTDEWKKILGAQNRSGDTPLHLAAAFGHDEVCHKIAELVPKMVTTARNKSRETPLFTAVRYGKKTAFFMLETAIHDPEQKDDPRGWLSTRDFSHCRRSDGDTILHSAIRGEHFGMWFKKKTKIN